MERNKVLITFEKVIIGCVIYCYTDVIDWLKIDQETVLKHKSISFGSKA